MDAMPVDQAKDHQARTNFKTRQCRAWEALALRALLDGLPGLPSTIDEETENE